MSSTASDQSQPETIVLIHGMWMTPLSWEHWASHYNDRGHRVLALDFSPQALKLVRRRARQARLSVEVSRLNVNDVRSTLPTGARLAFERRPRHVYARLLLDGVRDNGRLELLRFAQMVSRQGLSLIHI